MPNLGTSFEFFADPKGRNGGEVLIVPMMTKPRPAMEMLTPVDSLCDDAVSEMVEVGALGDEVGDLASATRRGVYRRILAVSLGDESKLEPHHIRNAARAVVRWLSKAKIAHATLWMDGLAASEVDDDMGEWALGMTLAGFSYNERKKLDEKSVRNVKIAVRSAEAGRVQSGLAAIAQAQALGNAVNYARSVAHEPPNAINPQTLALEAQRLAKQHKLKCSVIQASEAAKLKMGGLLAVGMGASAKPCLIRLDYKGAPRAATTIVVVGKAVTFDTGGYSIKPAANMEQMKFDKSGGCVVLGLMKAAATLKLKCNLIGLLAAAENAISRDAYRPGDIITMMNGKTVEITNTDAEGRLVLGDALCYAQQKLKPTTLIDLATLTGGVVVALGKHAAGLMSNNDELQQQLEECGRQTRERLWPLPLWDDYKDLLKGVDSDIRNSAGKRDAHPIVGGIFLQHFVEKDVPWAHLDIAGVSYDDTPEATGFGVRLLVEYLRRRTGA